MYLSEAEAGKNYVIERVELSEDKKRRILDFGFTKGTKIRIISLEKRGPMIISVRGTYIAMGRKYALGIFVQEMES